MLGEAAFAAQQYNITQLQVHFVSNSTQCATVVLKDEEGNVFEDAATGSGSIEAIYNAIQRILGLECELADYRIQSITQGQDALAHVHVELRRNTSSIRFWCCARRIGSVGESICPRSGELKSFIQL